MTMILNEYEIDDLSQRFTDETPNLQEGARRLQRLMRWTNQNSDGWCYWRLPGQAARKLQELLASIDRFDPVDCTKGELNVACSPIKAFLTRQGVDHDIVFTKPPPDPRWMVSGPNLFTPNEVAQDSIRAGLLDMVASGLPGIEKIEVTLADDAGKITYELVTT